MMWAVRVLRALAMSIEGMTLHSDQDDCVGDHKSKNEATPWDHYPKASTLQGYMYPYRQFDDQSKVTIITVHIWTTEGQVYSES